MGYKPPTHEHFNARWREQLRDSISQYLFLNDPDRDVHLAGNYDFYHKHADQILALFPKLELISDEEIDKIGLTEDDISELEQTATIGLEPNEHIEYEQCFTWLCNRRLKEKSLQAQLAADQEKCK